MPLETNFRNVKNAQPMRNPSDRATSFQNEKKELRQIQLEEFPLFGLARSFGQRKISRHALTILEQVHDFRKNC